MGQDSAISWTLHTFNPWVGCSKVSPGCQFCYAETLMDKRYHKAKWGDGGTRVVTAEANWRKPALWNKWAAIGTCYHCGGKSTRDTPGKCTVCSGTGNIGPYRARVFCASLADVFEDRPDLIEPRARLLGLIFDTPNLDWLLLTKRPSTWLKVMRATIDSGRLRISEFKRGLKHWQAVDWLHGKPPKNVWLGVSVEDQQRADERIPILLQIPAAVRFLSCEPLLGPLNLEPFLQYEPLHDDYKMTFGTNEWRGIDWVIVGGESGPGARPMHPNWARSIRDQVEPSDAALHFKQWGEFSPEQIGKVQFTPVASGVPMDEPASMFKVGKHAAGRLLDGRTWDEFPKPAETMS